MPLQQEAVTAHTDVIIVGAGISGIGAAYYLQRDQPQKSYTILEAREASGGTWDLFRYPGIRSDSDLHTFGYEFKPWVDSEAIAGADRILDYLRTTAAEHGIESKIRYRHKVLSAAWSSAEALWTVVVERQDTGERLGMTCNWIFAAAGYYRYDEGFTPKFEGRARFKGEVIHPQHWPEDLDYAGKRILVIGSGATAVTLVPALAKTAAHVTMLQRTPTYVMSLPAKDPVANGLRKLLPERLAFALTRRKNIAISSAVWRFCQKYPKLARRIIRHFNRKALPEGYPVDEHFNPPYNPWDQRLCAVPDGDLFRAIKKGKASVVTDRIATFTEQGLTLESGRELEADIIVTATGLNLLVFGGIELTVDGKAVDYSEKVAFKGMMLDGVPNLAFAVGYTNSSWTLKIGLLCEHFCRLLAHMDEHGFSVCVPELPSKNMKTRPLLDFGAGYVRRSINDLPRQGEGWPWVMSMDYQHDKAVLRKGEIADTHLRFEGPAATSGDQAA